MARTPAKAKASDPPDHVVQLYDGRDSAAEALAQFINDGFANGEDIVVIARLDDWNRAAVALASQQLPLADAIGAGRLLVRESRRTLDALLIDGVPSAEPFEQVIAGPIIERLARGRRLRAYGDMVDLLAADGGFDAAEKLEDLWNDLRRRAPFMLFCGYSSAHFCSATGNQALSRIRHQHSQQCCSPTDVLAQQLMTDTA